MAPLVPLALGQRPRYAYCEHHQNDKWNRQELEAWADFVSGGNDLAIAQGAKDQNVEGIATAHELQDQANEGR